jgi:hypothetical protein
MPRNVRAGAIAFAEYMVSSLSKPEGNDTCPGPIVVSVTPASRPRHMRAARAIISVGLARTYPGDGPLNRQFISHEETMRWEPPLC